MSPNDEDQTETERIEAPGPMLDMSQADGKKMIAKAKAKGDITYDELTRVLPADPFPAERDETGRWARAGVGGKVVGGRNTWAMKGTSGTFDSRRDQCQACGLDSTLYKI